MFHVITNSFSACNKFQSMDVTKVKYVSQPESIPIRIQPSFIWRVSLIDSLPHKVGKSSLIVQLYT